MLVHPGPPGYFHVTVPVEFGKNGHFSAMV